MSLTTEKAIVRKNGRGLGEVFTNRNVIEFLLDEVGYISSRDLSQVRILEPAVGTGAFAKEILKRLYSSSRLYNFSFSEAIIANIKLFEVEIATFSQLRIEVQEYINGLLQDNLSDYSSIFINKDFLMTDLDEKFDCIVGNPPYIRNESIPFDKKIEYKKRFPTFKYRADLYIPFYEHSLSYLRKGGRLSFICSNRWLYNQYGAPLRELISTDFHLDKLVNIEKSSPFDEDVIAYPCITTLSDKLNLNQTLFYETEDRKINLDRLNYRKVNSPKNASWETLFFDFNFNSNRLSSILGQGFNIGIGVATGADKIFILNENNMNGIERERLLPLVNTKDLTNNGIDWKGKYVINPFIDEHLCNLDDFPKLKSYFLSHKEALAKRYVSKKMPENWYRTIDRIKPCIQSIPKLLIPDMNGGKKIILDKGRYYPHHNLYYITGPDIDSLKVLGAILLSSFVDDQISKIGICMNGGLARFQAQTLKKIKIPIISTFSQEDRIKLISAFDKKNLEEINGIIEGYCDEK